MPLSSDLISQFVKVTKDATVDKTSSVVYGTVVYDGKLYVKLDGSEVLTPVTTTSAVEDGERVTVKIENHTATITGNVSSPAARTEDVNHVAGQVTDFENIMAGSVTTDDLQAINAAIANIRAILIDVDKLTATEADIQKLEAIFANLEHVTAKDITAITAQIESLEAIFGTFTDLSTENLEALNAEITNLKGYTADFTYVSAEVLEAVRASVKDLSVKKLDASFANIDFAEIDKATIEELYAGFGLIEDAVFENGTVTGKLAAVEIHGDYIKGGTIRADRLILKDEKDGLYYQLNIKSLDDNGEPVFAIGEPVPADKLHGSVIEAQSITANKIAVTDLVAFGATIGGFDITDHSIHSHLKDSVDNLSTGFYVDKEGQLALGDDRNFIRFRKYVTYEQSSDTDISEITEDVIASATVVIDTNNVDLYSYEDSNGITRYFAISTMFDEDDPYIYRMERVEKYKLAICADEIHFGSDSAVSTDDLKTLTDRVKITTIDVDGNGTDEPCIELSADETDFKQVITNDRTRFMDGSVVKTEIYTDGVETENVTVRGDIRQGGFVWATHGEEGNYGLLWRGVID